MAAKWYRSKIEPSPDGRNILVGGAHPGEVFSFDYDRPGFNAQGLIDQGVIEEINEPTKADLADVAHRKGHADVQGKTKEELVKLLEDSWEG